MHQKIDWQLANYFPQLVSWVAQWAKVADSGRVPILITHQEDLRTDEKSFFDSILKFYGIDIKYRLPKLPRTVEETHFRRAEPTEWRNTFSPEQVAQATSMIPLPMMRRFGWDTLGAGVATPMQTARQVGAVAS